MSTEVLVEGGLASLSTRLAAWGARRVLVLTSPSRRFVDELVSALPGLEVTVFDRATVHVPAEVVGDAEEALRSSEADTVVALGGGAATGLGKALRLSHEVRFVAVPTTYSGSEMTSIYGITTGRVKRTGRDPRVRPDLVIFERRFTESMPIGLTVQGLYNALSHLCSMLFAGTLAGPERTEAISTIGVLVDCTQDLLLEPRGASARTAALAAAASAGRLLEVGKTGAQHALAHLLGGRFALEHAALHAVLLPQFVAHARATQPALVAEIEAAIGRDDLEALLHDTLARAGAPVGLGALGVDDAALAEALEGRSDLPADVARNAREGLRPTARARRVSLDDGPAAMLWGPEPARARRIVVALHGRGANAGTMLRRVVEILGHDPETCVVALRAPTDRWYAIRYHEPGAGADAEALGALAHVRGSIAALRDLAPGAPIFLMGFSQGSCLALELAATGGEGLAGVIAPSGARLGRPAEWVPPARRLDGLPVLLGASAEDPWVAPGDIEATEAWFTAAGAVVERSTVPGNAHEIVLGQRRRAREIVTGREPPPPLGGYGNVHESEALPGALPRHQNSPRRPPHGLWAEQINGTGFVAPRKENLRTWMYRVRPSAERRALQSLPHPTFTSDFVDRPALAALAGLRPRPAPEWPTDFVDGIATLGGAGSPTARRGFAVHLYAANRSMEHRAFTNADGELLLIPQVGALTLWTELGALDLAPGEIAVLPRGLLFSIVLRDAFARGYLGEVFGRHFVLPERGPVGANGLADPRHFRAPVAWYEDRLDPGFRITTKLGGRLHEATQDHSPFDVVAWHGNHVPTVYDLSAFSPVAGVRVDHVDPSIYTVLSAPLDEPGASALDLVAFVPRWDPTEGTFRPPFFHRNATTEINGVIRDPGEAGGPFAPGSCFLTPPMTPHGVRARSAERARSGEDRPHRLSDVSLWFQFESALPLSLTSWAEAAQDPAWHGIWGSHRRHFDPAGG